MISAESRKKNATVHVHGKAKFPISDAHSASSALKLINHAKPPLTPSQKAAVRAKAKRYVGTAKVAANQKSAG